LHPSSAADAFQHTEFDQARQAGLKRLRCCFVAVDTIQQEKVMRIERRLNFPTYPLQELDKLRILYLSMKGERNLPGIDIGKIRQLQLGTGQFFPPRRQDTKDFFKGQGKKL